MVEFVIMVALVLVMLGILAVLRGTYSAYGTRVINRVASEYP